MHIISPKFKAEVQQEVAAIPQVMTAFKTRFKSMFLQQWALVHQLTDMIFKTY